MASQKKVTLEFEKAEVIFKNFSGRELKYNKEGDRNFNVEIEDEELAFQLYEDGWNVKPRDDDNRLIERIGENEDVRYHLPIKINFDYYIPPKIIMVIGKTQTRLDEDMVHKLDEETIKYVDVIFTGRYREKDAKGLCYTAYLQTMYAVVEEDRFASKYANEDDDIPF